MKKENFKYLYSFKYNNKEYIYLISKNYPFYFLEYNSNTNNFEYPDIDTFRDLYSKFYSNDNTLNFNLSNELNKIKKALLNMDINITPLIKTTSGLISIVLVLSMCGCTQVSDTNTTSIIESSISNESQDIYDYFKSYNMDIIAKEYDNNGYIFVREFLNSNNKQQITLQTFEEFREFSNIDFIPSWDDVINAFQNNKNIDDEKKGIIIAGINTLRNSEELNGFDLSVLYVNAKRMKLNYLSSEEMVKAVNRETVYAYFDTVTGDVYLPNDKPLRKFEFIHEVLGHGALAYRKETENFVVVFDCTNHLMLPTDNRYTGYSVGIMVSEGGANMIAHIATNDYSASSFYELYEEELRVIAELCNVSIGQLFNYKGISLYDLMYENGINTPVEYIFKMDGIYRGKLYCEFSDLMERLFVDATEEKIINADENKQQEIITETIKIITDSYFKEKNELSFDYIGGTISYNFEESANKYEENMNQLRGKNK